MNTVDWDSCPTATHYTEALEPDDIWCAVFWLLVDGKAIAAWQVGNDGVVGQMRKDPLMIPGTYARMIPRPSVWNGEGLPLVGTQLECGFACENFKIWRVGVCVAVGEDPEGREEFCVVKSGNKIAMYTVEGRRMRPIRTAEQIAAIARENAIIDMLEAGGCTFAGSEDVLAWAEAIYDAGYRKQAAA